MSSYLSGVFLSLLSLLGNSGDVDFVFFGDAMQHAPQFEAARRGSTYDYSECFQYIEPDIKGADYAVVNLEVSLGGAPYTGYPCFSAPDEWAAQLQRSGFDLLLTANNHCLDRRDKGVVRTIEVLDRLGIPHIGTYVNSAARAKLLPYIETIKGLKVAFLDYTYGTNGIPIQKDVVVDYIDKKVIAADIAAARRAGGPGLWVEMHWGIE